MEIEFHNPALERLYDGRGYTVEQVEGIAHALRQHRTLEMTPLHSGLYPASSAGRGAETGYHHVWVRDNVYVALSQWIGGRPEAAVAVAVALLTFYRNHRHRFALPAHGHPPTAAARPHVRFNGERLTEIDEPWAHSQNDALGYCLWLCARLSRQRAFADDRGDVKTMAAIAEYFHRLRYWQDQDSGHWEETRKRSASSIGVVVAAFREWVALLREAAGEPGSEAPGDALDVAVDALRQGEQALAGILPHECVQPPPLARRHDAALLFLVYPLGAVSGAMASRIVDETKQHLQGAVGIRRYNGDSYWAPDYDTRLPPGEWSRDYSNDIAARDRLLEHPGDEAQWCLFDPILAALHGQRFLVTGSVADRDAQALHFNRALAHVTADWQCPELYYKKRGVFVANPHTPLLWTQANLQLALAAQRATAGHAM